MVTPTSDAVARLTPRLSEPPQVSSYATLGSAAVDTSLPAPVQLKARRSAFPVVAGIVVAAVGIAVFSLAVMRPSPTDAPAAASAPLAQPPSLDVTAATALSPAPSATAPARDAGVATAAASSAAPAKAGTPGAGAPPQQRWAPPAGAAKARPAKTVDDGF
jgi:hypothetical protein